jgi:hypothetical protein
MGENMGTYLEHSFVLFWYLVFLLLIGFPVLFALWLWVFSLGTLIGQAARGEILSLKHIHVLLVPLTALFLYLCYELYWQSLPSGESPNPVKWVTAFVALLVFPYAALLLYRYYQTARPEKYGASQPLSLLKAPGGVRHGIAAALIGMALAVTIFAAELAPQRLLIYGAKTDNMRLVKPLVDWGTNVSALAMGGHSPLWFSCRNGNVEMARLLLEKGAKVPSYCSALYIASMHGRTEILKLLLARGTDVNCKDSHGNTALIGACIEYSRPEVVALLLERGADVNAATEHGATALFYACSRGNVSSARLLLEKGADPEVKPRFGSSPMLEAMRRGNTELVQLLKSHGAKEP